jgi:hypothetical protein
MDKYTYQRNHQSENEKREFPLRSVNAEYFAIGR